VALAVLAVLGTIGGAWGGQFIAGRNDSRRWQRERDREAQAFWRDKRLEVYAVLLAGANEVQVGLWRAAGFDYRPRGGVDEPALTMEHLEPELRQVEIIGSDPTVELVRAVDELSRTLLSVFRHPSRSSVARANLDPTEA
jgi:hypothetical protein